MRRFAATRAPVNAASLNIGIQLTRRSSSGGTQTSSQSMNIVRNISGPVESDLDGSGSGALPGTEPGLAGDYQYQMDGIISTDVLSWRGEDSGLFDPIAVTLVSSSGNVAIFNFVVTGSAGVALIYCSVNGTEYMTSARIAAP